MSEESSTDNWLHQQHQFDGLVQERRIDNKDSSALAMELRLSCIEPSSYSGGKIENIYFTTRAGNKKCLEQGKNSEIAQPWWSNMYLHFYHQNYWYCWLGPLGIYQWLSAKLQ